MLAMICLWCGASSFGQSLGNFVLLQRAAVQSPHTTHDSFVVEEIVAQQNFADNHSKKSLNLPFVYFAYTSLNDR
jgi:hypothetical protein